ncbi:MAG: hypothetical protein P8Y00_05965, partial [Deltaproteobacteria bacterium]
MNGMDSRGSKRVWWWLLFFLVLGALIGYLLRGDLGKESEKPTLSEKTAPSSENTPALAQEKTTTAPEPSEAGG